MFTYRCTKRALTKAIRKDNFFEQSLLVKEGEVFTWNKNSQTHPLMILLENDLFFVKLWAEDLVNCYEEVKK